MKFCLAKIGNYGFLFLLILTCLTRFWHLSYPPKVVFDETHFALYATKYLSHQYYFDIHPPLGKLLFGGLLFVFNEKPGFDFQPSAPFNGFNFLLLRSCVAIFGCLLVLLIYFLVLELGFSKRVAFFSGFFILFNNAFVLQSRLILLDILLVFSTVLSLFLFFFLKRFSLFSKKWWLVAFLLSISLGSVISIKFIGFIVLFTIWFWMFIEEKLFSQSKKEILTKLVLFFFIPLIIYSLIFLIHLALLTEDCQENCGFILEQFKTPLDKSTIILKDKTMSYFEFFNSPPPGNILEKFIQTNYYSLMGNIGGTGRYYYESDWFSWPFMIRPIRYFEEQTNDNKISALYFLGNPLIWWLTTFSIIVYFYLIIKNFLTKSKLKLPFSFFSSSMKFIILSYLSFFLLFASIQRFTMLYHYLIPLVFASIILAIVLEGIVEMIFGPSKKEKILFQNKKANIFFFSFLIIIFIAFLYFSPLTYGFPLNERYFYNFYKPILSVLGIFNF